MSRINELKKQYPELNITMLDLLSKLDKSGTYKYLPLICKIFGKRWSLDAQVCKEDKDRFRQEIKLYLGNKGIDSEHLSDNSLYVYHRFADEFIGEYYDTMNNFMKLMDQNLVENNDVTSYKNIDEIRSAVTLASMKMWEKELEGQAHKEYEDDKWLITRPLTFSASCKYGSSTRWCTTYKNEKQYFERYWRRGILVYFINKLNGYKVAAFKALDGDSEFSFWNAEDSRVDFLEINFDDYLYSIIRAIFKSNKTNQSLCTEEIQKQVNFECVDHSIKKMAIREIGEPVEIDRLYSEGPMEVNEAMSVTEVGIDQPSEEYYFHRGIDASVVRDMTEVPVYEERPSIA